MKVRLPIFTAKPAWNRWCEAIAVADSTDGNPGFLLESHLAIPVQSQRITVADASRRLDKIAKKIQSRVTGVQPQAMYAQMHHVLFDEMGMGILNDRLPELAMLNTPSTMALFYKLVADRLGFGCWAIAVPETRDIFRLLLTVVHKKDVMKVDAARGGRILSTDEVKQLPGRGIRWSDDYFHPISPKVWLTYTLQDMVRRFLAAGVYEDVAAVLELEIALWPKVDQLKRDLALILARLGEHTNSAELLAYYLSKEPDDANLKDLEALLGVLRL